MTHVRFGEKAGSKYGAAKFRVKHKSSRSRSNCEQREDEQRDHHDDRDHDCHPSRRFVRRRRTRAFDYLSRRIILVVGDWRLETRCVDANVCVGGIGAHTIGICTVRGFVACSLKLEHTRSEGIFNSIAQSFGW